MSNDPPPRHPSVSADAIADCVLSAFATLPEKRKPRRRDDGAFEWVPLSGIVLARGTYICLN